jgi:NitT/TauT family transport system substrate-binding protein
MGVRKKWIVSLVLLLLTLAPVSASARDNVSRSSATPNKTMVKVRIAMNQSASSLPIIVAKRQGFFTKYGIIPIQTITPNITIVPPVLGRDFDIGFTVAPIAINAMNAGVDVKIVAADNFNAPNVQAAKIIARPEITSPQQLKGKTVAAVTLTGSLHLATKAWLAKSGVNPSEVRFVQVPFGSMLDQLKAGIIDAAESNYPFSYLMLKAGFRNLGDAENAIAPKGRSMDSYWLANGAWATSHRSVILNFRKALDGANAWMLKNKHNGVLARKYAATFLGLDADMAKNLPLNDYVTKYTVSDLAFWGDLMRSQGGYTGSLDYSKLIYR